MLTKNRIGNALAVAAAVLGLVLVFSGAGHGDDTPAGPPSGSQVVVPPGQVQEPVPGQTQAPAQPTLAPAVPPKTNDDG